MSTAVLDEHMRSAIRPRRDKNQREQRLKAMQEDYQIPLIVQPIELILIILRNKFIFETIKILINQFKFSIEIFEE